MSESFHTYSCVFHDSASANELLKVLGLLQDSNPEEFDACMKRAGIKPAFKGKLDPFVDYLHFNENFIEFKIQLGGDESIPVSFIEFIHRFDTQLIISELVDIDNDVQRSYIYIKGKKSSKKDLVDLFPLLSPEVKLLVAALAVPKKLPQCIKDLGGVNSRVFGKPLLFYVASQPNIFFSALDNVLATADLNAIDLQGNNVLHHLAGQEDFDKELFCRFIELGVDVTAKNGVGEKPVFVASKLKYGIKNTIFIFTKSNDSPNILNSDGMPFLHYYIKTAGLDDFVIRMINNGGDINILSPFGTAAWLARESSPHNLNILDQFNPVSKPGHLTYINDSQADVVTAIRFRDNEMFDSCLPSIKKESVQDLVYLCLKYGYLYGFECLEEHFQLRVTVADIIPNDRGDTTDLKYNAYNYCWIDKSSKEFTDECRQISFKIIKNSDPDALRNVVETGNLTLREAGTDEEAFLELINILKSKGIDVKKMHSLSFNGLRFQEMYTDYKPFGKSSNKKCHSFLRRLLDAGLDFSKLGANDHFIKLGLDEKDLVLKLIESGHPEILTGLIINTYVDSREELLSFLLTLDLKSKEIQQTIWETFFKEMSLLDDYCYEFSEGFVDALVNSGFALNQSYPSKKGGCDWSPYGLACWRLNTRDSMFDRQVIKSYLESRGVNK